MRTYDERAKAARFLLGGIGTGTVSLNQNGRLVDFELFNTPDKGFCAPYTFFALHAVDADGAITSRVLESQWQPPHDHSHGYAAWEVGGLPRFRHSRMQSRYPFVSIELIDDDVPLEVELCAFNPMIPLNTDDSSLPCALLRYSVKNTSAKPLSVSVSGSMLNLCNFKSVDIWGKPLFDPGSRNRFVREKSFCGIHFDSDSKSPSELHFMDMALLTTGAGASFREYWNEGAWWDGIQDFWNDFTEDGELSNERTLCGQGNTIHKSDIKVASLCVKKRIEPGTAECFEFLICWHHPNRIQTWFQRGPEALEGRPLVRNYCAKFGPSLATARYVLGNLARLEGDSRKFSDALYNSSLPSDVIEAVANNITVLRSNTCFRLEDGAFFGFEGQFDTDGCCHGNCTHVWNYAQTVAYLFPELEQSMRRTEFLVETGEDGYMSFRASRQLGDAWSGMPAATDGQLGCIIRLYRDFLLSGDEMMLRTLWPKAQKALDYAALWDSDGDGILDSNMHNTYDIEFYGLSSMMNSIYYAALRAAEEICTHLGNHADAGRYRAIREKGSALLDEKAFNGEFYVQVIDDVNRHKYQYGNGCLSDQLFGQQLAHQCGLGYVLDEAHVKRAVRAIFENNFLTRFDTHVNLQRTYALNDDAGLINCSWPDGGRPEIPFVYSDEVWTGIEYQVATHLIYEGFVDEALKLVKAVRDRHDGIKRSPWNEVECGHHYARSMASYGLLLAMSNFRCDAARRTISFAPVLPENDYRCFFCCGHGWGVYHRAIGPDGRPSASVEVLYGSLSGYTLLSDGMRIPIE